MPKGDIHTEYFSYQGRKNCECGMKQVEVYRFVSYPGKNVYTKTTFCFICFEETVYPPLSDHAVPCGCVFQFQSDDLDGVLPDWITPPPFHCAPKENHD